MQFYRNTICQDYQDLYGLSQHFYSTSRLEGEQIKRKKVE